MLPARVIIELPRDLVSEYCIATGYKVDTQQYQEIVRQIMDIADKGFTVFTQLISHLPRFDLLINEVIGSVLDDREKYRRVSISEHTQKFAVGIYLYLNQMGVIRDDGSCPYILETTFGNNILLTRGADTTTETINASVATRLLRPNREWFEL